MASVAKRTVSLPEGQAAYIDARVAAGDYPSSSAVVRAGLEALRDRDEAVERWLHDEVAPAYDHAELTSNAAATLVWTYLCGQLARKKLG